MRHLALEPNHKWICLDRASSMLRSKMHKSFCRTLDRSLLPTPSHVGAPGSRRIGPVWARGPRTRASATPCVGGTPPKDHLGPSLERNAAMDRSMHESLASAPTSIALLERKNGSLTVRVESS